MAYFRCPKCSPDNSIQTIRVSDPEKWEKRDKDPETNLPWLLCFRHWKEEKLKKIRKGSE